MKTILFVCSALFIFGTTTMCASDKNEQKKPATTGSTTSTNTPSLSSEEFFDADEFAKLKKEVGGMFDKATKNITAEMSTAIQTLNSQREAQKKQLLKAGELIGGIKNIAIFQIDNQPMLAQARLSTIVTMINDFQKSLETSLETEKAKDSAIK